MPIDIDQSRSDITAFLEKNNTGVLASADNTGKPHAATVYFTFDKQLNLYFITKKETQKSRNLQANPRAAIAIFDVSSQTTVQAEGTVSEVIDPRQQEWIFNDITKAAIRTSNGVPPTSQYIAGGYVVYKLLAPTLRKATFNTPDPNANSADIFEVIHTQPSL